MSLTCNKSFSRIYSLCKSIIIANALCGSFLESTAQNYNYHDFFLYPSALKFPARMKSHIFAQFSYQKFIIIKKCDPVHLISRAYLLEHFLRHCSSF